MGILRNLFAASVFCKMTNKMSSFISFALFSLTFSHVLRCFSSHPSTAILQLTSASQDKKLHSTQELKLKLISTRLLRLSIHSLLPWKRATFRTKSESRVAWAKNEISYLQCTSSDYRYVWIINYIVFVNKGSEANPVSKQSRVAGLYAKCMRRRKQSFPLGVLERLLSHPDVPVSS